MYDVMHMPSVIEIGYVGEKSFRTLQFDLRPWLKLIPDGSASVVLIRPGETASDAYIAASTFEEGILSWTVAEADLGAVEGYGQAQIWLEEPGSGTTVKRGKSAKVQTYVKESVTEPSSTIPPTQTGWMEQMTALKADTVAARNEALLAVTHYPYIDAETFHWMVWDVGAQEYVDTGVEGRGIQGPTGPKGPKGDRGADGIVVLTEAYTYTMHVDENGDLIMTYIDETTPPDLTVDENGDLILTIGV